MSITSIHDSYRIDSSVIHGYSKIEYLLTNFILHAKANKIKIVLSSNTKIQKLIIGDIIKTARMID